MLTLVLLLLSGQVAQDPGQLPADAPLAADASPEIRRDLTGMTHEQLEQESKRLDALRPKFFGPAGLMIAGGVVAYSSLVLFIGWIAESLQGACISFGFGCFSPTHPNPNVQTAFLVSGFATLAVAVAGLVVGGIWLKVRGAQRRPYSDAIEAVEARVEILEKAEEKGEQPQLERTPPPPAFAPSL